MIMITGGKVGKIPKKRGTKMFSPPKFNPPKPPPPPPHTHTVEVAFDVWLI